jgi:hypothetical protein
MVRDGDPDAILIFSPDAESCNLIREGPKSNDDEKTP